jgi:hypothetical protein
VSQGDRQNTWHHKDVQDPGFVIPMAVDLVRSDGKFKDAWDYSFIILHSEDHASWCVLIMKANEMHCLSYLFDKVFYMFWTPTELARQIPVACIQCRDTPEDGQWTCPKHVE